MSKLSERDKFKYWLDSEITILHIFFYITWGILIGGKSWYIFAFLIGISVVYAFKRGAELPNDYLKVKK